LAYCEPLPDFVRPDPETEKGFHCLRRMQMRSIGAEEVVAAVANGHGRWLPREKRWAFHHEGTTVITDGRRAKPITCFRETREDSEDGAAMEPRFVGPCCAAVPPSAAAAPAGLALVGRPFLVTKQQFAGSFTLRGLFRVVSVTDIVAITVRTSGISGGDWGDATDGVSVELTNYRRFGDKRSVSIVQRGEHGRTLRRVDFPSGFIIAENTRVRFELAHTPTRIACTFTAVGSSGADGAAVTIAVDTEAWAPANKSHVALYNREKGRMTVLEHMELRLLDQPATDQLVSAANETSPLLSLPRPAGATCWGNDTYTLAVDPALCPTTQEMSGWHRQSEVAAAAKALVPARAAGAIRRELARQATQLGNGSAGASGDQLSWRARGGSGGVGRHDGHRGGSPRNRRGGGWGSRCGS
jgi:hypothetical protein